MCILSILFFFFSSYKLFCFCVKLNQFVNWWFGNFINFIYFLLVYLDVDLMIIIYIFMQLSLFYPIYSMHRLFELYGREDNLKLTTKELLPLQTVGPQKCLAFSVDGSRFAAGGVVSKFVIAIIFGQIRRIWWFFGRFWFYFIFCFPYIVNLKDGHLRIFEWPNMQIILDEPRAQKSFQDMDFR